MQPPLKPTFVLMGLAYVLGVIAFDAFSNIGLYRNIGVSPWSPSTGLTLAFAHILGRRSWPYVYLAAALSLFIVNPVEMPAISRLLHAALTAAVWAAAGLAMHWVPGFDTQFRSVRAALVFFAVTLCASAADTALYIGHLWVISILDNSMVFPAAWRFMVGELVGVVVVAPLVMLLGSRMPLPKLTRLHLVQLAVLLLALWIIFNYREATAYQLFYLLFLPLLWATLRDGFIGAAMLLNVAQIGIIVGAHMRFGITPGVGALQILMLALAVTALLVGVVETERRAAAQRLRDQQAALNRALRLRSAGETAAAIAHQMNQPLTAISTYASIASDALARGDSGLASTTLDKVNAECDRAAAVIRSVRELVKQGGLTREPVRLGKIVNQLVQLHSGECAAARITMHVDIPPEFPEFYWDPVQLEQALENLINNSIESIRDSGKSGDIIIAAAIDKSDALIEVSDDGPGFAPRLETLATTPFMTTKPYGSGLGLAIARSVAESHGGSLAIVPRSSGATVRIRLPAMRRPDATSHQHH